MTSIQRKKKNSIFFPPLTRFHCSLLLMNCHLIWDRLVFLALAMCSICLGRGIYGAMPVGFISLLHICRHSVRKWKRGSRCWFPLHFTPQKQRNLCLKTILIRWFIFQPERWVTTGRLLIKLMYSIFFSTNWNKHAKLHLCRCSASCANYILVACMIMSWANRTATHNCTVFMCFRLWAYVRVQVCVSGCGSSVTPYLL